MHIQMTRIVNVEKYLSAIPPNAEFSVVIEVNQTLPEKLAAVGFSDSPDDGDTILPQIHGPISRYNAEGKWVIRRDLSKEPRYIRTVRWQWKQWSGQDTEEHEDFRDIWRDCYPRELIPPSSIELTYRRYQGREFVTTRNLVNNPDSASLNRHAINLALELFGNCDLAIGSNFEKIPEIKRVNWRFLPPGKYPWDKLAPHLEHRLSRANDGTKLVILDRQETIKFYQPDELYVGEGGFSDYIGYVFKDRNIVVLESIQRDNAIYVFGEGWDRFSSLTKAEIISGNLHRGRIVHAKGWKQKLHTTLLSSKAA